MLAYSRDRRLTNAAAQVTRVRLRSHTLFNLAGEIKPPQQAAAPISQRSATISYSLAGPGRSPRRTNPLARTTQSFTPAEVQAANKAWPPAA